MRALEFAGSPDAIGRAHGLALGDDIRRLLQGLDDYVFFARPRRQALAFKAAAIVVARMLDRSTAPRHRRELRAIARAAEVTLTGILLINYFDDLLNILRPLGGDVSLACSVAIFGEGHRLVHARNLDYYFPPSFTPYGPQAAALLRELQTVTVIRGEGVNALLTVGYPGYAGVVTGWSDRGISLGSLTSYVPAGLPSGVASGFLYRQALEVGQSIGDVRTVVDRLGIAIGNNLLLAHGERGEYAALELAPREPSRTRPAAIDRWATNHFVTPMLAARQLGLIPEHSYLREARVAALHGRPGAEPLGLLLDRDPLGGGPHGAIDNPGTVQSVVFDHGSGVMSVRDWATETWSDVPWAVIPWNQRRTDTGSAVSTP